MKKQDLVPSEEPRKKQNWFIRLYYQKKWATIAGATAAACIVILVIVFGIRANVKYGSKATSLGFKDVGELATQAAYVAMVGDIQLSRDILGVTIPLTNSRVIYSYDFVIRAGYDFEKISVEKDDAAHTVTVIMPQERILSSEVLYDTFQVYYEDQSIYTPVKAAVFNESTAQLQEKAQSQAIENGLFENARENAQTLIRGFLASQVDLSEYTVQFYMGGESEAK